MSLHTFIVYAPDCTDSNALARRMSVRESHITKAREELGNFVESGGAMLDPTSDLEAIKAGGPKKMIGSVLFVKGNTLEEVTSRIKKDIYYTSRVWDPEKLVVLPYIQAIHENNRT